MITRRQLLQSLPLLSIPSLALPAASGSFDTDVAVIGSGPAGVSLASKLAEAGIKVMIIESGALNSFDSQAQLRNKVVDAGQGLPYQLGFATKRIVGGTSSVWGGHCPRLKPDDLLCKSKYAYSADWPIKYEELESYYCEAEKFLQVFNPANPCSSFLLKDGSYPLAEKLDIFGFAQALPASVTVDDNYKYSPLRLHKTHLPRLLRTKKLSLLQKVTARNFEVDKSGKIKAVICQTYDGRQIKVACKSAVICAGAIQSARLLMLFNKNQDSTKFGIEGGQLGANFMDHPVLKIKAFEVKPPFGAAQRFGQAHLWQWYGNYRKAGVGAYLPLVIQNAELSNTPLAINNQSKHQDKRRILHFDTICEQEALSSNRFELSEEKDDLGDPLVKLWYKSSSFDQATLKHAEQSIKTVIENSPDLALGKERDIWLGSHHLMGTTRMAANDKEGVVDKNLKVFGSKNLYVSSGSVFPSGGAANPTLTITALSIRLANHLIKIGK